MKESSALLLSHTIKKKCKWHKILKAHMALMTLKRKQGKKRRETSKVNSHIEKRRKR